MIRLYLTYADLQGLIVYTPMKLEAAASCHILFLKLKRKAKRTLCTMGLWNSLDVSTKSIQCKYRFKECEKHFFSSMKKSENSQVVQ